MAHLLFYRWSFHVVSPWVRSHSALCTLTIFVQSRHPAESSGAEVPLFTLIWRRAPWTQMNSDSSVSIGGLNCNLIPDNTMSTPQPINGTRGCCHSEQCYPNPVFPMVTKVIQRQTKRQYYQKHSTKPFFAIRQNVQQCLNKYSRQATPHNYTRQALCDHSW